MKKLWPFILFTFVLFGGLLYSYWEEDGIWGIIKVLFVVVLACGYAYIMFRHFDEDVDKSQGVNANSLLWRDFNREQRARRDIERLSEDE